MAQKIQVAILDDHQSIIDGYLFRLSKTHDVEVVATAASGSEFEALLAKHPVNVALLDVNVPTAPANSNPYPILFAIPKLLDLYPDLAILVISMLTERPLVRAIMKAGASGYILKDDRGAIEQLGSIVQSVAKGGIYLSESIKQLAEDKTLPETNRLLTARQLEALSLAAAHPHWSRSDLAAHLNIGHSTARNLLSSAYLRLNVPNLTAAISKARHLGLITFADSK